MGKDCGLGLAIVDMQEPFLEKIEPRYRKELISNQQMLLSKCCQYDIPVSVLEFEGEGSTIEDIRSYVAAVPRHEFIKPRRFNSGFHYTGLAGRLEGWGVESLIVSGVNAHACVFATAECAKIKGFQPIVSKEIVADIEGWNEGEGYKILFEPRGFYVEDIWGTLDRYLNRDP